MHRVSVLLVAGVLLSAVAYAAGGAHTVRRISLDQAIAMALSGNRSLKAAELSSDADHSRVGVARGAMIPHLDALENWSETNSPWVIYDRLAQQDFGPSDFNLDHLNHPGMLSNFQSQVRVSFPLFAGGRLIAAYRAAGFAAEAGRWNAIRTRQDVEFAVLKSYFNAVLAEQRIAVVGRALAAARAHLRQAHDRFRHGMAVDSDVLRTKVKVGELEQQRIEAQSQRDISRARLAHTLGADGQELAPLEHPFSAQAAPAPGQLQALTRRAVADRPEVRIADSRVKQARQQLIIARADYLPSVGLSAAYENDSEKLVRAGNNASVFVTAKLNLFDGLSTRSKVDAAQAELSRAKVLADDLRHAVALEVQSAYRTLIAARQGLKVARHDTRYADSALKILDDRYAAGLATNVAVLDAESAREEADMGLAAARVALAVDRAALDLAIGAEPSDGPGR